MIRIILPLICAALGFAAASCSQSEGPPAPAAEAPASPPQPTHDAASAMTSPVDPTQVPPSDAASTTPASPSASDSNPPDVPAGTQTERRASTLIGMAVVGTDGTSLGKVKDIIFDRQGRATHIVIAYGKQPPTNPAALPNDGTAGPTPDGKLTAMPWDAAMASIKGGQLVLDSAQLQAAPSYAPGTRHNLDDPDWNAPADAYWRKAVQEAIEAHPGAPIDSPSRSRDRPDRDDE